ncbi:xylulokinase [Herbiconiux sp. KACC 21604]|uniref:xylulokinase n=1 Tax=unclassified Herbiconiux TaxID=2618217 RepID=UPI001C115779|nr:xylulokinase [Herbiconiux sp. SALV-R1]WPO86077.1 xylulokinase [Herbiconiux sp. KACC 21604]
MPVVAGVDSSTQSTTVVLRDADTGATLGSGRAPHTPTFPPVSEQNPAEWWAATIAAFAAARAAAGVVPDDIVAVSVAAQCHGLVPLDARGQVIRPAKLWNDTTAAGEIAELTARLGGDAWTDRVGTLPPPSFTIGKLAWLKAHEPENFAALATVLLPHDYLTWRLTGGPAGGRAVTDRSDASGTGYYSAPEGRYLTEVLELIDADKNWAAMLPDVLGPSEHAGTVPAAVATELGVRTDAVVGAGAGDQHASAVGLGIAPGELAYVLGTSGVVFTTSEFPVFDHTGIVNSVADATGAYLPLICTLNAAKVTDTVARLLGVDHAELERLALSAEREAERPVLVSFLDGERTPNRPAARGLLAGLSNDTSREDLALAAYEGVVLGMERGERRMAAMGLALDGRLLVTGGGAASAAYRQIVADVTGRPVEITDAADAVAAGAAVQAAAVVRGADIRTVRSEWAPASRVVAEPQGVDYRQVRERYTRAADITELDGAF